MPMTNPRFASNIMPDPIEVARRAAAVSYFYDLESNSTATDKGGRHEAFFGLASDRTASTAVVNTLWFSEPNRVDNDLEQTGSIRRECAKIGYYDPARQMWMFYPECVLPEEQQRLGEKLEEVAPLSHAILAAESRTDDAKIFIDMRNPVTVYARNEMASLLTITKVAERLIVDNPIDSRGRLRQIDEATTATLVLAPKLARTALGIDMLLDDSEQYSLEAEQALSVAYSGLIMSKDGKTRRVKKEIPIADCQDDGVLWTPNLKMITTEEWQVLGSATKMLKDYKELDPNFSAGYCAVAHALGY